MKYHSLPKDLYLVQKQTRKQIGQPGWNSYIKPIDQLMPEHNYQCQCLMCSKFEHKKFNQALSVQTKAQNQKIKLKLTTTDAAKQETLQKNFQWVVRRLMIPTDKIATRGLKIYISQVLFYKEGQPSDLYLIKQLDDPVIKKIAKQKLNNGFIQKLMSDRKRKYKDYIRIKTGRDKNQQKKRLFFGQKQVRKQIKDAVLIRHIQGYEQLYSQNQFLQLSLKRKQDMIWKQISSIRNYINIMTNGQVSKISFHSIKFNRSIIKYEALYERSLILMKVIGQYITAENDKFISYAEELQFCKNLQGSNLSVYAEYLTYQIVSFIQYFYDQQINVLHVGIHFDEVGHAYLNQVYQLQAKSLIKFAWTNQIYRTKMNDAEQKILTSKQHFNQDTFKRGANGIIEAMHRAYQKTRDRLGLTAKQQDNKQQIANNSFFKIMHPQINYNISDVLRDPNLSLTDFKQNYLGLKPKKKPIVKQFTSNLIRTLHLTCAKLQTTNPHEYIQSPRLQKISNAQTARKQTTNLSPIKQPYLSKLYQTLPVNSIKRRLKVQ